MRQGLREKQPSLSEFCKEERLPLYRQEVITSFLSSFALCLLHEGSKCHRSFKSVHSQHQYDFIPDLLHGVSRHACYHVTSTAAASPLVFLLEVQMISDAKP